MYQHELDIGRDHDVHTTYFLAMHHLEVAAALFDRLTPAEFAAANDIDDPPATTAPMLAVVAAEKELEAWLDEHQTRGAQAMLAFDNDDPAIEPIWTRYADELTKRLTAAGRSPEQVDFELGEMAARLHEMREAASS